MESLPLGKQAGPDRIPNGIFKCMSHVFAKKYLAMLEEAIANGELPRGMLQGDISVMYKKKERNDPRNYRPLTMLLPPTNFFSLESVAVLTWPLRSQRRNELVIRCPLLITICSVCI